MRVIQYKNPLCACDKCGLEVKSGNKYILGHNRRGKGISKSPSQLCWCGCGEMTEIGNKYIHGHNNARLGTGKQLSPPQLCACDDECGLMTNPGRRYIKGHFHKGNLGKKDTKEKSQNRIIVANEVWGRKEYREKHHQGMIKAWDNKEIRERHSKIQKIVQNRPERRKRNSQNILELWQDPEYVMKQMESRDLRPNKPESFILFLLNRMYPREWKYTGDFSFTIGGKNPDFVNINGQKKCIEFFGDYWHRGENPNYRKKAFAKYGWDTLIIWEHELEDIERVKFAINKFNRKESV